MYLVAIAASARNQAHIFANSMVWTHIPLLWNKKDEGNRTQQLSLPRDDLANFLTYKEDEEEEWQHVCCQADWLFSPSKHFKGEDFPKSIAKANYCQNHNPRSHVGWLIYWRNLARGLPISRDSKSRLLVNWSWDQKWKTTRLMLLDIQTLILHNQRSTLLWWSAREAHEGKTSINTTRLSETSFSIPRASSQASCPW